ncbi:aminoacyl-tRNA hydrolase [Glaciecola siphonariae]|uniref:Peptidyl-tRNA hydrolase n=1 Tax=Glaciecola siphonariae TaxID=521012 RepID=A0ABV9LU29_9ALTE
MSDIRLIVGLGNPGPEYQNTRHNAGAMLVESLASWFNIPLKYEAKFFGFTGRGIIEGKDIRLLIPTTFMNKSGQAVGAMCTFYKVLPNELLVAYDELDFEPGIAKFKIGGSSSQNGIRDIVRCLANQKDFLRLRVGIGHPGHKSKVTGHVLSKAPANEQALIEGAIDESIRCIQLLLKQDLPKAQQRLHAYNAAS